MQLRCFLIASQLPLTFDLVVAFEGHVRLATVTTQQFSVGNADFNTATLLLNSFSNV